MIVIVISLIAAAIQMVLLLLTAKVIGVEHYARFSLILASAMLASAGLSEWLRLIVTRHGGSRRKRFRAALLLHARRWVVSLALGVIALGLVGAALLWVSGDRRAAGFAASMGVVAGGTMLSDMVAAFLRYVAREQWHYNVYSLIRVTLMGGASLAAALLGGDGPLVAGAFGIAGMVVGGGYVAFGWPVSGRGRAGLMRRLSGQGWSLATGSIGTNLALTLARITLGLALPARISGSALLSIDLFARGGNVLCGALCGWGNRILLDGVHDQGKTGAGRAFRWFSGVFLSVWFAAGLIGLGLCLVIPIRTLPGTQIGPHIAVTLPTLAAIMLLFARIFLFDCLLGALNRHREIALIGSLTVASAAAGSVIAWALRDPVIAAWMFPATVCVLLMVYIVRNRSEFRPAVDTAAMRFALAKLALAGGAIAAYAAHSPIVIAVVAAMVGLDIRQACAIIGTGKARRSGVVVSAARA